MALYPAATRVLHMLDKVEVDVRKLHLHSWFLRRRLLSCQGNEYRLPMIEVLKLLAAAVFRRLDVSCRNSRPILLIGLMAAAAVPGIAVDAQLCSTSGN